MNPQAPVYVRAEDDAWLTVAWYHFHAWRGHRPFWAGLFTFVSGFPIAYFPYADLRLGNLSLAMATTGGAGALIIGVLLITLGLALWFQQAIRVFAGVASILLALVSLPVSNLGGFGLGFVPALIGGALALAWVPGQPADEEPADQRQGAPDMGKAEAMAGPQGFPGQRETEMPAHASETTAHADGGRNSAG
ncbi:DUF6114 domain-containing protein [Streptomyces sp. MB09-01]|uniref:DUF6114 domain-containing protein n=1 Tax=Streptomyces sp. MB09-01 TaxID=3028666 RepID=UPI0029AEC6B3|nr:DUF6114 domain-containing protein [Streptomyces sp. MB09-01]MDX3537754.1 DUF6114 domain-containing protein [Streptomyces sp. MB09-01]